MSDYLSLLEDIGSLNNNSQEKFDLTLNDDNNNNNNNNNSSIGFYDMLIADDINEQNQLNTSSSSSTSSISSSLNIKNNDIFKEYQKHIEINNDPKKNNDSSSISINNNNNNNNNNNIKLENISNIDLLNDQQIDKKIESCPSYPPPPPPLIKEQDQSINKSIFNNNKNMKSSSSSLLLTTSNEDLSKLIPIPSLSSSSSSSSNTLADCKDIELYNHYVEAKLINKKVKDIIYNQPQESFATTLSVSAIGVADVAIKAAVDTAGLTTAYGGQVISQVGESISSNPILADIKGLAKESMLFAVERTRYVSDRYISFSLTADDPETVHLRRIQASNSSNWELVRLSLVSLTHLQRQLIEETREEEFDEEDNLYNNNNDNDNNEELKLINNGDENSISFSPRINYNSLNSSNEDNTIHNNIDSVSIDNASELLNCSPNLTSTSQHPSLKKWLAKAAEDGDEEAQYALTRIFVPPSFSESDKCFSCENKFNMALFRHHCRHCGKSICTAHSLYRRKILRYGMTTPVRVCNPCARLLDEEVRKDGMQWRHLRTEAYLRKSLIPYYTPRVDRGVDKAMRVIEGSFAIIRNTLCLNYSATLIIETIAILRTYGLSGLAGVLLRRDFVEAVETLKRISGMEKVFALSLHELTACIYYKLAIDRGLRGSFPDEEFLDHQEIKPDNEPESNIMKDIISSASNLYISNNNDNNSIEDNNTSNKIFDNSNNKSNKDSNKKDIDISDHSCKDVNDEDIDILLRFAPLALNIAYEESAVECQRIALSQGWSTIYTINESIAEQPAYSLFATDYDDQGDGGIESLLYAKGEAYTETMNYFNKSVNSSRNDGKNSNNKKEVVLAIRGTATVHDVVTDIRSAPQEFPPSPEEIKLALAGLTLDDNNDMYPWIEKTKQGEESEDEIEKKWEWLQVSSDMKYACGGMARAALWLLTQVGPSLMLLHSKGYKIYFTGHSLGGAVASMLTYMLQDLIPTIRSVGFACPSCVDAVISDELRDRVTTVILHDDIVARITPHSIRRLIKELVVFRSQVFRHLREDWVDVIARAGALWSPKWRDRDRSRGPNTKTIPIVSPISTNNNSNNNDSNNNNNNNNSPNNKDNTINENDMPNSPDSDDSKSSDDSSIVIVEDDEVPELWLPGRILHIYSHRGQYKISQVSRSFVSLRQIQVQGNIFNDHLGKSIFDALLEVRSCRQAISSPPPWMPYDSVTTCQCCDSSFTWHSTFQGKAQEYREKYNCHHCGQLVCGPCSENRKCIPKFGLLDPIRICDKCFYRGDYASMI